MRRAKQSALEAQGWVVGSVAHRLRAHRTSAGHRRHADTRGDCEVTRGLKREYPSTACYGAPAPRDDAVSCGQFTTSLTPPTVAPAPPNIRNSRPLGKTLQFGFKKGLRW